MGSRASRFRYSAAWGFGMALLAACATAPVEPSGGGGADAGDADARIERPEPDASAVVIPDGASPDDASAPEEASAPSDASAASDSASVIVDGGTCAAPGTCATANTTALASIAGDQGTPSTSAQGTGPAWLQVRITDTGGVFRSDNTLAARLTLTSPPGTNFDLYALVPGKSATPMQADCSATPQGSTQTTLDDVLMLSWPDVTNGFGDTDGDGRVLSIEVRYVSGPCPSAASWTLKVEGNTL